jgi:hypothetical protein
MSEYLKTAIVTASAPFSDTLVMFKDSVHTLVRDFQFELRGYGGIDKLKFRDQEYVDEQPIQHPRSLAEIDDSILDALAHQHRWFLVTGSFRFPDAIRLYDAAIGIYPVFEHNAACLVSHLDASLYNDLWDENDIDYIDLEAAAKLRSLAVLLGAHARADGFNAQNTAAIRDIITFDGEQLRDSLVNPRSIHEKWRNRRLLSHGMVSGIKRELCDLETMRKLGDGCDIFETITGHVVLSTLVEVDPSIFEGLDLDD